MRFEFQLEGLLNVRRLLERQARERLDASMAKVRNLEHALDQAVEWSQQSARVIANSTALPAGELQFIESVLTQTGKAIVQFRKQKQAEEQNAAKLRAAYLDARRERKIVSTLRENALHQFQIEQSRREQSALDELYLGMLVHSRNNNDLDSTEHQPI